MAKTTYTVQAGDNLAKLAEQFYGDQRFLTILLAANGGTSLIHPGDVLKIPDISGYQKQLKESGEKHYIAPGLWNAIKAEEAMLYGASTCNRAVRHRPLSRPPPVTRTPPRIRQIRMQPGTPRGWERRRPRLRQHIRLPRHRSPSFPEPFRH